jgi:hypothetical protein
MLHGLGEVSEGEDSFVGGREAVADGLVGVIGADGGYETEAAHWENRVGRKGG